VRLADRVSDQERLLYAILAPSPQTASLRVWQRSAIKASQELSKLEERFWEGGVEAVELGVQDTLREQDEVLPVGDRSLQRWKI
jgi:hypothetical protein